MKKAALASMHRKLRKKVIKEKNIYQEEAKEKYDTHNCNINITADKDVLEFIDNFMYLGKNKEESEVIRKQFRVGYCYYFAEILKAAFNRGAICWAAPFGHIVWMDNGIPYDIEGINCSDCDYYIPISYIQEGIDDFKHVPNKTFNASAEYIQNAIKRYISDQKK